MAIQDIDYRSIRPHGGGRDRGFEELVCQLASLEPVEPGAVFHRKGIGADGGVECFVRHADGSETGWQAKYFFELETSQIGQLNESIKQALGKHPRLRRFVVGLPFDLRDARVGRKKTELQRWEDWKSRWENEARKNGHVIQIDLWSASNLTERLGRDSPRYRGRAAFWFDELTLTPRWFKERFEVARAALGARYTPETNIELPIRQTMQSFCRNPSVFQEADDWAFKINEKGYRAVEQMRRHACATELKDYADALESDIRSLLRILSDFSADPGFEFPLPSFEESVTKLHRSCDSGNRALWELPPSGGKKERNDRYAELTLSELGGLLNDIEEALESNRWRIVNSRRLLVSGDAGVGKSHLFGDAVEYQLERGWPALLVLGGGFVDGDPWSQILATLGLQNKSTDEFLGALDAAGQASGTRTVVFVDAINERRGIDVWPDRIAAFLKAVEPFPHVGIALSCRTAYLPYIVPVDGQFDDLCRVEHSGFAGRPEAANAYLDLRGIVRMAAPNLVPEFYNPLFLKTCCDVLDKQGRNELPRGLTGVTAIFEFYSDAVAQIVDTRLRLDRRRQIVPKALRELASAFEEGYLGYTELSAATAMLDALLPSDGTVERSLLAQLESEGVLAVEPVIDDDGEMSEIVRFTFERYSDHRIAALLLNEHFNQAKPVKSFEPGSKLAEIVLGDKAFERAGVIEALAIQIPELCGKELSDLIAGTHKYDRWLLHQAFLKSVLWRKQEYFTNRTLELLEKASSLTGKDEAINALISIATEPSNQFNAFYLHERLTSMPMPKRDETWSLHVLQEGDSESSPIETLISWCLQNGANSIENDRAALAATILSWLFTTSHRAVRDRATKALASLLAPRLAIAKELVERFASVDDPYVLDRVLATSYGAALQGMDPVALGPLSGAVFEVFFKDGKPPTHVLIRDHARGIIELARQREMLPSQVDLALCRPPYTSEWPLEVVTEDVIDTYKQDYSGGRYRDSIASSTVRDGDFARYVIDSAVSGWTALGIEWAGSSRKDVFEAWKKTFLKAHPRSLKRIEELMNAADQLRREQRRSRSLNLEVILAGARSVNRARRGKKDTSDLVRDRNKDVLAAERKLKRLLSESEWQDYLLRGQSEVYADIYGLNGYIHWPPRPNVMALRRWVCKRAHDLGWTAERFSEIERYIGSSGRMDHRIERVGKKYQWIALHQLCAHLADNLSYKEGIDGRLGIFDGPWDARGRDIDPSLLVANSGDDGWRSTGPTWWMPTDVRLRHVPPKTRLAWLESDADFVNGDHLIQVKEPKTGRRWLVLSEFVHWYQWGVSEGDKHLERGTWFGLDCLLVNSTNCEALIRELRGRSLSSRDLPEMHFPWRTYLGEYPWHPSCNDLDPWVEPDQWNQIPVPVQGSVAGYRAERGDYDYSILESLSFKVPSPGVFHGIGLQLSNGRRLTYTDNNGRTLFFDPSTQQAGPSAALVDRDMFLTFLQRDGLEAVWVLRCEKNVHGGPSHSSAYGGSRHMSSVYWMNDKGEFKASEFFDRNEPSPEQLEQLLAGD